MKVTVKKNLIIFHRVGDWNVIYQNILAEYGTGMAVRSKLCRDLGFLYREHQAWYKVPGKGNHVHKYCEVQIHLDFYSESAQSWFQLKYLNLSNT